MTHKLVSSIVVMTIFTLCDAYASHMGSFSADTDTVVAEKGGMEFTELAEVVVEGRTQRVIDHGVEYIPNKRTKKAAMDAISLLRLMAIPQLDLTPNSPEVKMIGNRQVSLFIDYAPATPQDLAGLRPEDVLSVEVLQYPADPRFNGAAYVVNYIMQQYEWGGYTKVSGDLNPITVLNGGGSLYTKYSSDVWTFDAAVGAAASRNANVSGNKTETYEDFNLGEEHITSLERLSQNVSSLIKTNKEWALLRCVYAAKGKYLSHTASFSRSATPWNSSTDMVSFSHPRFPDVESATSESTSNISPSINGYYYFILPHASSLVATWKFNYGHNKRNYSYTPGTLTPILNNNREDVYSPDATFYYTKKFPGHNTLRLMLSTNNSIFNTRYGGSFDGVQKLISSENMLFVEYMKSWSFGLNLYSRVGVSYVYSKVNGVNERQQWNPRLGLQLQYMANQSNSIALEGWLGNSKPGASYSNSAIIRSNEFMWIQGNPDLRNTLFHDVKLSYNLIPGNEVSLALVAQYQGYPHMITSEYITLPGYAGVVNHYSNDCHPHEWTFDATGSVRLMGNSLMMQGGVTAKRTLITGVNPASLNNIAGKIAANYFIGNLAFTGYYVTPVKYIDISGTGRYTMRSTYGLSATYSNGDFNVSISSANWWNSNRLYFDFNSGHYSASGWRWDESAACNLKIALSYTFPYGKKVDRNNEVESGTTIRSAILK